VSSENPRDDVGAVLATLLERSFFSVTMLAPSCCEFVRQKQKTRSTALAVGGLEIRL
jgi:hypothetical protein